MRYLHKILCFLFLLIAQTSYAAFPTTSLLDSFTRADEGPPPSASWGGIIYPSGDSGLRVVSNTCQQVSSTGDDTSYWGTSFNADQEIYFTVSTKTIGNSVVSTFVRIQSPGTSGVDGYVVDWSAVIASTDQIKAYRMDNFAFTQLGSTISQEYASGDLIGISAVGGTLDIQYNSGGGGWVSLGTRDGSAYNIAGFIGLEAGGVVQQYIIDDFSGGNIPVVGGTPTIPNQAILF